VQLCWPPWPSLLGCGLACESDRFNPRFSAAGGNRPARARAGRGVHRVLWPSDQGICPASIPREGLLSGLRSARGRTNCWDDYSDYSTDRSRIRGSRLVYLPVRSADRWQPRGHGRGRNRISRRTARSGRNAVVVAAYVAILILGYILVGQAAGGYAPPRSRDGPSVMPPGETLYAVVAPDVATGRSCRFGWVRRRAWPLDSATRQRTGSVGRDYAIGRDRRGALVVGPRCYRRRREKLRGAKSPS
jgi:hypothetical protein